MTSFAALDSLFGTTARGPHAAVPGTTRPRPRSPTPRIARAGQDTHAHCALAAPAARREGTDMNTDNHHDHGAPRTSCGSPRAPR